MDYHFSLDSAIGSNGIGFCLKSRPSSLSTPSHGFHQAMPPKQAKHPRPPPIHPYPLLTQARSSPWGPYSILSFSVVSNGPWVTKSLRINPGLPAGPGTTKPAWLSLGPHTVILHPQDSVLQLPRAGWYGVSTVKSYRVLPPPTV